jgi:hypothetical protein
LRGTPVAVDGGQVRVSDAERPRSGDGVTPIVFDPAAPHRAAANHARTFWLVPGLLAGLDAMLLGVPIAGYAIMRRRRRQS